MTAVKKMIKGWSQALVPVPTVFDITARYEPSAHFQLSRRMRNQFDGLATAFYQSTWMLGSHGGKARMNSEIQGIGVATGVEVGRLVFRAGKLQSPIESAFELLRRTQEEQLASGALDRLRVGFSKADQRPLEREQIRRAFGRVFGGGCSFVSGSTRRQGDNLEVGHCVAYQTLEQYLREDGLYHHVHRDRIEGVRRHLHQEVGRYESHHFYVRPQAVPGDIPELVFCYTGDEPDKRVEAFMQGYTEERLTFVPADEFRARRDAYVDLRDYERASRRFGSLWVQQGDLVRSLAPEQISGLYLFLDEDQKPELGRFLSWDELFSRQQSSPYIHRASRNSQTFLEIVLEGLVRKGFVAESSGAYGLAPDFQDCQHVSFYHPGEYRKRQQ